MAVQPLIGRRAQLEAVERSIGAVVGGTGGSILVTGEAGIGKSAVARSAIAMADSAGARVVVARAPEGTATTALGLWTDLAGRLGPDHAHAGLPGNALVRRLVRGEPLRTSSVRGQDGITEALVAMTLAAADVEPLVLVLEDLHDTDVASLRVTTAVMQSALAGPVLVLATARLGESDEGRRELLDALIDIADHHPLVGLDADEIGQLVPDLFGQRREILELTGGNPFFILEAASLLRDGADRTTLPPSVRETVRRWVGTLPDRAVRLLEVAAVIGGEFDLGTLARASDLDHRRVERHALDCLDAGLLVDNGDGSIRFAHALVSSTIRDDLDDNERAAIHLRVADALVAGSARVADDEVIVGHLYDAGALVEPERLVDASVAAAHRARSRFADDVAAGHVRRALTMLDQRNVTDPAPRCRLLVELSILLQRLQAHDDALSTALQATVHARASGDAALLAHVALAMPPRADRVEVDELANEDQLRVREEALAALGPAPSPLRARLLAAYGTSLYWAGDSPDRAERFASTLTRRSELTAEALDMARRLDDRITLASCLNARLFALWGQAGDGERERVAAELRTVIDESTDVDMAMSARMVEVMQHLRHGRIDQARHAIGEYAELAEAYADPAYRWVTARWQSCLALLAGELESAEALATGALDLGTEVVGAETSMSFYGVTLGAIRYLQGRTHEIGPISLELAESSPNVPAWWAGVGIWGVEAERRDLCETAMSHLAPERWRRVPRDLNWLTTLAIMSPVVRWLGDTRAAAELLELMTPYRGQLAVQGVGYAAYGPIDRFLGMHHATLGDVETAWSHYRAGIDLADRIGDPYAAIMRVELAEILIEAGDAHRSSVEALLDAAIDELTARGLTHHRSRAERLRGELAPPTFLFIRDGQRWTLGEAAGPRRVRHRRGLAMIRELLARPGRPVAAVDLLAAVDGGAVVTELASELLDDRAREAYRRRVDDLRDRLDTADRRGDQELARSLEAEMAMILDELGAATGLAGRARRAASAGERARVNVTKNITRTLDHLEPELPGLVAHLRRTLSTGGTCLYEPEGDIVWDLG